MVKFIDVNLGAIRKHKRMELIEVSTGLRYVKKRKINLLKLLNFLEKEEIRRWKHKRRKVAVSVKIYW